jgi:hypothetical protein
MRAGMMWFVLLVGLALVAGLIFMDWGAAVVASTGSSPTPFLTNTPPALLPSATPVDEAFMPVVFGLETAPTATQAVVPTKTPVGLP